MKPDKSALIKQEVAPIMRDEEDYIKKVTEIIFQAPLMGEEEGYRKSVTELLRPLLESSEYNAEEKIKFLVDIVESLFISSMKERKKREKTESDLKGLLTYINGAFEKYNSPEHTRSEQRARAVVNYLGITNGKRQEKTNKKYMFYEYMELIYGSIDPINPRNPISKKEALKILKEKYKLKSENPESTESILEQLLRYTRKVKKQAEQEGQSCNFSNILPGRDPYI